MTAPDKYDIVVGVLVWKNSPPDAQEAKGVAGTGPDVAHAAALKVIVTGPPMGLD